MCETLLDVQPLPGVFRTLIRNGATVLVIKYDLNGISSADYIIDMVRAAEIT